MKPRTLARGALAVALSVWIVLLGPLARSARAELVSTEAALGLGGDARTRVVALLEREDVRTELARHGVTPEEARARIAALRDDEVERLAGQIDALPAGSGAAGVIVTGILIIFFTLLITDILGFTDVFPFVRKPARR